MWSDKGRLYRCERVNSALTFGTGQTVVSDQFLKLLTSFLIEQDLD